MPAEGTLLIVDDDEGIAYLQSQALQRAGFEVVCAASEAQALEHLANHQIDLIILDYRLPGERTGLELFADLKAAGYHQPVIMATGFGDEAVAIEALRAGVRDFVAKSDGYLEYLPVAVERVLSQIRLEERLANSEKQLRQSQKMEAIGTLAGGIAHEFNNLLQVIQGYTRCAMEEMDVEDNRLQDLQQVIDASERAATLTRQLLGFGRQEELQMSDIEPNSLVRDLVQMIRPLIGEHITIDLRLQENVGLLHADAGHLQQLLMNLCVNARDAMPHGGQLTVKTESLLLTDSDCGFHLELKPGRYAVIVVADTGCGMPAEVKDHIFEPFFTTKEIGKGTGLGLAMVYGVVHQHNGAIHVDSEVGVGTTFRVYLPTSDRAAIAPVTSSDKPPQVGSEMILIAEDELMVRTLAVRILESAGYRTIAAVDGMEAVELLKENFDDVSLAILDIGMPRMGGREAFLKIKSLKPEVPAIFSSGYNREMAQVEFITDENVRMIQKPFRPQLLLETVREVLDGAGCEMVCADRN